MTSWLKSYQIKELEHLIKKPLKGTKGVRKVIHSINEAIIYKDFIVAL